MWNARYIDSSVDDTTNPRRGTTSRFCRVGSQLDNFRDRLAQQPNGGCPLSGGIRPQNCGRARDTIWSGGSITQLGDEGIEYGNRNAHRLASRVRASRAALFTAIV